MWSVDSAEREHVLELLGQLVRTDDARFSTVALQSTTANAADAQAKQERHSRGLYTLPEAAQIVADANALPSSRLLADLRAEAKKGRLTTRRPDTLAPADSASAQRGYWVMPADLDELFAAWGVAYRFPRAAEHAPEVRRVPAQQAQEQTILAKLRELGFDPLAVPKPPKEGNASPAKKAARDALNYSRDVFNKAWQRLRNDGRLKDAEP